MIVWKDDEYNPPAMTLAALLGCAANQIEEAIGMMDEDRPDEAPAEHFERFTGNLQLAASILRDILC